MKNYHYVGRHINKDVVNKSSSGGIMTAVSEWIFCQDGVVFGAALVDGCRKVEHIAVRKVDELDKLRKSKYVWSNFSVCLQEMEYYLSKNVVVLFIGTPCQCLSVLKRFGKYSNLYLLDFYCHGTLDEKYYKSYIDSLNTSVMMVDFRAENTSDNFQFSVKKADGSIIVSDSYNDNTLTNLFVSSAGIRKPCFSCMLCENIHASNITMGDVAFEEMAKNHGFKKNHLSIISVNNEQGKKMFDAICSNIEYAELDERDRSNIEFYYKKRENTCEPWGYNAELRQWFENAYLEYGYEEASYRCMFIYEMQVLKKYENYLNSKKIFLYGAGKKGRIYKQLIEKNYPLCNLQGYIVSVKKQSFINELPVYEPTELKLDDENSFIIVSVEKKEDIFKILREKGLEEGVNYG